LIVGFQKFITGIGSKRLFYPITFSVEKTIVVYITKKLS